MKPKPSAYLACAVMSVIPRATSFVGNLAGFRRLLPSSSQYASRFVARWSQRRHPDDAFRIVAASRWTTAVDAEMDVVGEPGTADLDWENLGFEYRDVNSYVKFTFKDGRWDEGELVNDQFVNVHIANTALHYGQSVFEGLKAFHCKDGSVRIFRPYENAKRIRASASRILMEPPPEEMFVEACKMCVKANMEFVPPYGAQGSLYLRPLLFGSGARIGLQPADEYTLLVLATPVKSYYSKGGMKPTTAVVIEDYDRAAPKGVGGVKVAGNYAADMLPNMLAKQNGYSIGLYLDSKTNTLVEEFSTSNFLAVTHGNRFVTPESPAVLPSITNKSLMELAKDEGMVVERRPVPFSEVAFFKEVAACGTAVVITPINNIVKGGDVIAINDGLDEMGPMCKILYDRVTGIQTGDLEDIFSWMVPV